MEYIRPYLSINSLAKDQTMSLDSLDYWQRRCCYNHFHFAHIVAWFHNKHFSHNPMPQREQSAGMNF